MKPGRFFLLQPLNVVLFFMVIVAIFVQMVFNTNFRQKKWQIQKLEQSLLRSEEENMELKVKLNEKMSLANLLKEDGEYVKVDLREITVVKYSLQDSIRETEKLVSSE